MPYLPGPAVAFEGTRAGPLHGWTVTLSLPHVVIIGGGFAGLYLAQSLRSAPARVTLVDRRNFHLFQPLLYQVATGGLSPANIAAPLRRVLKRQRNARVLMAEVVGIDANEKQVQLADGVLTYDTLVLAAGAATSHFGNDEWAAHAPGLKTLEDATEMRRRVLMAFENAEAASGADAQTPPLRFVVVGGGPTGVELAGALAEIARDTLRHEFRRIDPTRAEILLIEGADRILPTYPPELSEKAAAALRSLGVTVHARTIVQEVRASRVTLKDASGLRELATACVLWAAGVRASRLGEALRKSIGVRLDRMGRVIVDPDCSVTSETGRKHDSIFVVGDLAHFVGPGGPLPGVAPVAMQQGRYVARVIERRLSGSPPPPAFVYRDKGNLATIGRARAVAEFGKWRASGFPAWALWLTIHIFFLIEFENRVLVLLQWAWNYLTWGRSARLITGGDSASGGRQAGST